MKKKIVIAALAVAVCLSAVVANACKCRAFTGADYPESYAEFHNGHGTQSSVLFHNPHTSVYGCCAAYGDFKSVR